MLKSLGMFMLKSGGNFGVNISYTITEKVNSSTGLDDIFVTLDHISCISRVYDCYHLC